MNESNISRDHIALEAMKIILDKSIKQRIRKLAGLRYEVRSFFIHNPGNVAEAAYKIADAMIAEREKGGKQ